MDRNRIDHPNGAVPRRRLLRLERLLQRTREAIRDALADETRLREAMRHPVPGEDAETFDESCAVADGPPPWAQAEVESPAPGRAQRSR